MLQSMMKRITIYTRGSTGDQTPDNQLQGLRAVAGGMGWQVAEEYVEHGVSGAMGRDQRLAYDRLHVAISRLALDRFVYVR